MKHPLGAPSGYRVNSGEWVQSDNPLAEATTAIADLPDGIYRVDWKVVGLPEGSFVVVKPTPIDGEE